MQVVTDLIRHIPVPKMVKVRQKYDRTSIPASKIPERIRRELDREDILGKIKPGMSVALTCGSRGIRHYSLMTRTIVELIREKGAEPFIVAAMGSHGGASEEGQRQILADYGITEETMGCPVKCEMETVPVGVCEEFGTEVRIDKNAAQADAILLFNRIKIHTSFHGPYESGLMKMMGIGLGKQPGAEIVHGVDPALMHRVVEEHGKVVLRCAPVIGGLAVVENAFDDTWKLAGLSPEQIVEEEPKLLLEAKEQFATLLFDRCDVLIVDRIGKNISGDGMDPNVTGRFATGIRGGIKAGNIVVLDLTDETHGNAQGIGNADVTTLRLDRKMSREMTYPTAVTNKFLCLDKLPMVMDNDREAIQLAMCACYEPDPQKLQIIRIRDTAHLEEIEVSESLLEQVEADPRLEKCSEPYFWSFNEEGNLW
ncbi:MAG: lactate racemase domain-containing protein [Eubacteriales bacterium]|nr:lactate racemase domain-containing protein [Eubacteriales bacterium]